MLVPKQFQFFESLFQNDSHTSNNYSVKTRLPYEIFFLNDADDFNSFVFFGLSVIIFLIVLQGNWKLKQILVTKQKKKKIDKSKVLLLIEES